MILLFCCCHFLLGTLLTGSKIDPDDNGIFRSNEQKEKWRKKKTIEKPEDSYLYQGDC